jgi:hypothetical protein
MPYFYHVADLRLTETILKHGLVKTSDDKWGHETGNGIYLYLNINVAINKCRYEHDASTAPVTIVEVDGLDYHDLLADEDDFFLPYDDQSEWEEIVDSLLDGQPRDSNLGLILKELGYRPYNEIVTIIHKYIEDNQIRPFGYADAGRYPGQIPPTMISALLGYDGNRLWIVHTRDGLTPRLASLTID